MSARRISLLATGGTISTNAAPKGAMPTLGAEQLAGAVSLPEGAVELRSRDVAKISGRDVSLRDMWVLAEAVGEEVAGGADGVVVTHGTDTLEETAYALALLLDRRVPVVVTGSMRVPDSPGADGAANLSAAVAVAADPRLTRYGPVVVLHDEIHLARWATKTHSAKVAAFSSPNAGPIGHVAEGRAVLVLGPPDDADRLSHIAPPDKRVEMLWAYAGADGLIVDAIADRVDGLVVAGTGVGHVAGPLAEAMMRVVASGRPVVLTSRCADGQVLEHTYGGLGSETQLLSEGVHSGGSLSAVKARLRLAFGLSAGIPPEELFPPAARADR
jgi:L-asparaginase